MDFGVVSLEGLVGPESGVSSQVVSDPEAIKPKSNGSGFLKQERSGSGEDEWRSSKMARTEGFDDPKTMLHQQLRSNSMLSGDGGQHQHQNMLSFSLPKSEIPFLNKNGGLVCGSAQNSAIPYYQHSPYAYSRNTGYGSGSSNAGGMHGSFPGIRGPFTPSQWIELEHQALIYKYIMANVPVPSNLLNALKKSINPFGLSGSSSFYAPNSFGWGSFHLGFSGNNDPEPGRCRRTDGKKWRCSRDAVPDQKYCERHINRGRHRSRKHVEGQTGHAVSGSTTSKVPPIASSTSASVVSSSCASNTLNVTQHQFNSLQPGATNSSTDPLINRRRDPQNLSMISPTVNLVYKDSLFSIPKHVPLQEFAQPEFGLVSYDAFLNPSQRSSYFNPRDYNPFVEFGDQKTHDQHLLRQFIDDWPKDRSNRITTAWPEELKSDWTQLSMSIPMNSDFSSSSSTPQEKLAPSPLRLSRELDPTEMGLGLCSDLSETFRKQTNCVPVSWGSSMGGPLGEVLNSTSGTGGACKNSSALKLMTEAWDGNTQLGYSPTGVLQKTTFVSLSNSSSGSSPRADKKTHEYGSLCDDGLGSTVASSFSRPSL